MTHDPPDPHRTRFRKGQSGNPRGRPKGAANRTIPYDALFGQMVSVTFMASQ